MVANDRLFSGSIPEIYDRLLVPLISETYAADLADRVAEAEPRHVLEIAAGTGVLTRAMAARLSAHAQIVATDLNPPMLALATERQARDGRIEWRQADALALPFRDATFDVVACQFGAMFFADKVQAYREAARVLKRGGHLFFSVWDAIVENEFAETVTDALSTLFAESPPRFLARAPHGYHDGEQIRSALEEAGFASASFDVVEARSCAPSARDVAVAYCQGTPLRNEIEALNATGLEDATKAAAQALTARFGDGPVEGRIRALVFTATL